MIRDEIHDVALGMSINYEGIFNLGDLLFMIDSFFRKRGYVKKVENHSESFNEKGKNINLKIRPFKVVKNRKLEVQVSINLSNVTDIIKKVDEINIALNKGKVNIIIDAFVIENVRGQWETRPEQFFIRTLFDKFLFKSAGKDYDGMVKSDASELKTEINSFLNLYKFIA